MTIAEKLRFLADREDDGKEFEVYYKTDNQWISITLDALGSKIRLANADYITDMRIKTPITPPQVLFTEDEKTILRSIPRKFNWIARDYDGKLSIHLSEPTSLFGAYYVGRDSEYFRLFDHLFKTIRPQERAAFRNQLRR